MEWILASSHSKVLRKILHTWAIDEIPMNFMAVSMDYYDVYT